MPTTLLDAQSRSSSIRWQCSPAHDFLLTREPHMHDFTSVPHSPVFSSPESLPSTPTTLHPLSLGENNDCEDDKLVLPDYTISASVMSAGRESSSLLGVSSDRPPFNFFRLGLHTPAADDSSAEAEPSRHVDYLSHEWNEEDIWLSWRYVTARRNIYSNSARLENASWRTWAKSKNNLRTISPETLNWLKDCDVTWLYGPLKTYKAHDNYTVSPPPTCLDTPMSPVERKPILKKKSASETILQRSLSQHTLLKDAGAILRAQEFENPYGLPSIPKSASSAGQSLHHLRTDSTPGSCDSIATHTSSLSATSPSEKRRHIHFNNEVVQCIAVEAKDMEDEDDQDPFFLFEDEEDLFSGDDTPVTRWPFSAGTSISNRSTPRGSFSTDSKIIAPLPPTTLKYRGDTPDIPSNPMLNPWVFQDSAPRSSLSPSAESIWSSKALSSSPPEYENGNSSDYNWQCKEYFFEDAPTDPSPTTQTASNPDEQYCSALPDPSLLCHEEVTTNDTIFSRLMDTINTARDIAHVIWNVGWQ
ncbi:hypothetical protein ASPZODRAFT_169346 [Penicilliopsis zonata CBS 506.65]|uniref:Nitrogen regulatory protein areA GATA-like domain-containing protein n=1 Tax=Penicilliopsis zonata CBS 506.65 TaxID=1073090 RepID=A0A1L9S968_9EURO|nr:hypothetical protein ASPZODRAFT_169346 [Penicilliopsis zonata CBS 506.65]OJJ43697.1 hypothetical protein ASPZODRAFT_169346 [Penicilliopsis zonata CBS 506.65]